MRLSAARYLAEGFLRRKRQTFDRSPNSTACETMVLAGGLNTENIAESIAQCHPWAVDVSSAVETNSVKDKEKSKHSLIMYEDKTLYYI